MALTITQLSTAAWTTADGVKTQSAAAAVGDLIVLVCAHSGNTALVAPTDNNSSGTYVLVNSSVKVTSADTLSVWVRSSLVTTAATTIFTHSPGTTSGGGLAVIKIVGALKFGAGAIRQSGVQSNLAASGTPTVALAAAALTTNGLIGAVFNGTNPATLTPRASPAWSERSDVGYNTPPSGLHVMTINSGETASSIPWGSTSASIFCSCVVEVDADAQIVPQIAVPRGGTTVNWPLISR